MELVYRSTRNAQETATASMAILKGLANEGGLFVPDTIPAFDKSLEELSKMDYREVAYQVMMLMLTDFTEEMLIKGGIEADFKAIKPVCKAIADAFAQGSKVHLTSPGGTDLWLDITGRRGNALYCVVEPGEFSTIPTVEANASPVEGSAHGRIVADASIPYLGIGVLNEPVVVEVENGFITSISGGKQAEVLKKDLESHNDRNCFNIAELGLGLNPKCRLCGIMLEDEGVIGTAHIGIGTSITLGGTVKAPTHYDLLMWNPRIEVDGKVIFEGTEVLI